MPLRAAKRGILGEGLQKPISNIDDKVLSTVEHTGLMFGVQTMMPSNSTLLRKTGIFLALSIAYNLLIDRAQSSESSGTGR
jgi:hypothetical protein|tara:strand:+ start:305 stop:547 length:243 start_codon:yes stop_codon:yes gene_type:complete